MEALTKEDWEWIGRHESGDPIRLRLKYHGDERAEWLILQMECRRKAAVKLKKFCDNEQFVFPNALAVEQATADGIADFHSLLVKRSGKVLDMTSGLGSDVFALAGKSESVTAIDLNPEVAEALSVNASTLGLKNITVLNEDSVEFIKNTDETFDTVFIDPARRGENGRRLFALADCQPDVVGILDVIMAKTRQLLIKASPMLDISAVSKELGRDANFYVVGTPSECKELVIEVPGSDLIQTVTVTSERIYDDFSSLLIEESNPYLQGEPRVGDFLYEPFPSVVKAGIFNTVSDRYGFGQLDKSTHLYCAEKVNDSFPGRPYKIVEIEPFNKAALKALAARYPEMSITVKNLRITAEELKKRMKTRESNLRRLFACTIAGREVLIVAETI